MTYAGIHSWVANDYICDTPANGSYAHVWPISAACPANSTGTTVCTCSSGYTPDTCTGGCPPSALPTACVLKQNCCASDAICDDGVFCNGAERCVFAPDAGGGTCQNGVFPCNDGNACTTDGCDADAGACTHGATCDDKNLCTTDLCDADGGVCSHPAVSCDDSKPCTEDSCVPDAGCRHALDAGLCVCTSGAPVTLPAGGSKEVVLGGVSCPGMGGAKLGASLKLSANGSAVGESCANACTSTGALEGSATLEASLCAGGKVTVSAAGKYALTKKYNPECDPATCGNGCGAGHCRTDDGSGSLTVGQSRVLGMDWAKAFPGGEVFLKCGGTLTASATAGGGVTDVSSVGAAPGTCTPCVTSSLSLSGSAGVALACTTGVKVGYGETSVGCKKCLSAGVKLSGSVSTQGGGCGAAPCTDVLSTVSVAGELPPLKAGFKWWSVTAACGASLTGCGEARSCGACTCGNGSCSELATKLSCSVCVTPSLLPACLRTP